jgi:hypothetical protein
MHAAEPECSDFYRRRIRDHCLRGKLARNLENESESAARAVAAPSRSHGTVLASRRRAGEAQDRNVQLGPRPFFLVSDMDDGELKEEFLACMEQTPKRTLFSIAHRGAPLQFPEHTKESYESDLNSVMLSA